MDNYWGRGEGNFRFFDLLDPPLATGLVVLLTSLPCLAICCHLWRKATLVEGLYLVAILTAGGSRDDPRRTKRAARVAGPRVSKKRAVPDAIIYQRSIRCAPAGPATSEDDSLRTRIPAFVSLDRSSGRVPAARSLHRPLFGSLRSTRPARYPAPASPGLCGWRAVAAMALSPCRQPDS